MMELIKWLFFLAIAEAKGLGSAWKFKEPSNSERVMQTILETCDRDDHLPNPIVILGNYDKLVNKFIHKSSFIRIDADLNADEYNKTIQPAIRALTRKKSMFKASKIILIEDSVNKMKKYLQLLQKTDLWNHMASFFIIGTQSSCKRGTSLLYALWGAMDILDGIYICRESVNNGVALFTINPITNYAPYPWESYGTVENIALFRQIIHQNISCRNLNYDKTKFLNGFRINVVMYVGYSWDRVGKTVSAAKHSLLGTDVAFLLRAMNATGVLEVTTNPQSIYELLSKRKSDISVTPSHITSGTHLALSSFPYRSYKIIAVVKLKEEVSTLYKILHIWSPQVLILAAMSLAVLFLILLIKDHDIGSALLDLSRLLVYTSVLTNNRRHSFRIYFTTMLIFMIISNGVFQGLIAAFLTKEERGAAVGTISELLKLGYKFKVPIETYDLGENNCPKCRIEKVPYEACVDYALNSTGYACMLDQSLYEALYSSFSLDYVKEPLFQGLSNFKSRLNWPLHNRFNGVVMKFFETGVVMSAEKFICYRARLKRSSMEADWNSEVYRPVRLYKLTFVFKFLALGLSFASIVFVMEILWAKYEIRKTKKLVIKHRGIRA